MNKDLNRLDRISALLVQLQSRPIVKSTEMAERFGVSARTIYRDMRTLSEAGVPICGNSGVGYSLIEGYKLPSLMFTKQEAIAFLTAEKIIEQTTDAHTSNHFRQGMDKVRAALRAIDKNYLHNMDNSISVYSSRKPSNNIPNLTQVILCSVSEKLIIEIEYTNVDDKSTKRDLEVVGITYSYPNWYMMAWCHLRNEYRLFRLSRIKNINVTDKVHTKQHPPLESLLGCENPECLTEVVLHTSKEISKHYADRCFFMGLTKQEELDNDVVEQTYMSYSLESIARWVLAHADTTKVIKPIEVKNIIKNIIQNLEI